MVELTGGGGLDQRLHRQLSRFLIVGAVGFGIDLSVMSALVYGLDVAGSNAEIIVSRVIAWAAAISLTYFLNAHFTFGASIRHSRFMYYLVIQAMGACINLGTFAGLVLFGPFEQHPLIAMTIGNAVAAINNFLLVRKFVYHFHPDVDDRD